MKHAVLVCVTAITALLNFAACAHSGLGDDDTVTADGAVVDAANGHPTTCTSCVIDSDCRSGVCAQLGGDSYCAMTCTSASQCSSGEQCDSVTTISGDQATACVDEQSTTCGLNPNQQPPPSDDGGTTSNTCPGFADPTTSAGCTSCTQGSNGCQPNGCYGGWWCNTNTDKCQSSAPTNCGSNDAGPPPTFDGGVTSNIGVNGGTESAIYFAVVGDTRPANEDDTTNYPTAIIDTIFSDIQAVSPAIPFVVSTGDYQFSNPTGTQASAQLAKYAAAKGSYTGLQFPAMGNHECTGYTASNCGSGNVDGITKNYTAFVTTLLGPIQKTSPYYSINVNSPTNAWTAKFVFVAANAWDSTQSSWLTTTLAQSTTYTFIMRHESASANTAPGVTPAEAIMAKYPYTLSIVGHSHEYYHSSGSREVVVGNGGAPISTNQDYGYAIVRQLSNGNIQVDMYDYKTNAVDSNFEFNVTP